MARGKRRRSGPRSTLAGKPVPMRPDESITAAQLAFWRALELEWEGNQRKMARDLTKRTRVRFTPPAIFKWTHGEAEPSAQYVEALADYKGVSVDRLLHPVGIFCEGVWRYPGDPTYERLRSAMLAVDPSLAPQNPPSEGLPPHRR